MSDLKLSAVLPLKADSHKTNSLSQVELLLKSMIKFEFNELLHTFYIVCPKEDVLYFEKAYANFIKPLNIILLDESELVPDLYDYKGVRGWRRQQIIKLAISQRIETSYFITFDSDVICTRKLTAEDVFSEGRALIQLIDKRTKQNWWTSSAHFLGVKPDLEKLGMNVTPAIMSKEVCEKLINELGGKESWVSTLLKPHTLPKIIKALPYFRNRKGWSEYSLYYTFLEKNNSVSKYHFIGGTTEFPQVLISDNSVWNAVSFDEWDPNTVFDEKDIGLFCVIQSNKNMDIEKIHMKLDSYIS
ncbi:MAG: hypothetical protein JXR03_19095 [Cyclobacteriaceae bacterium]